MKKLIALTMLAGLIAAGCSHRGSYGGSSDNSSYSSDSATGSAGASTGKPQDVQGKHLDQLGQPSGAGGTSSGFTNNINSSSQPQ
jgi:hypothetical protein